MSNYRRSREGTTYFFTVVTHRRREILCLDGSRAALQASLADARRHQPFVIDAWVLLPDHLHCIWTLPDGDTDYSTRWGRIKAGFTKRVTPWLATPAASASREKHREGAVWQRRFWEHMIRDERDFVDHCDYVHFNPVKHALAATPKDWPFSTFHRFVEQGIYPGDWGETNINVPDRVGRE